MQRISNLRCERKGDWEPAQSSRLRVTEAVLFAYSSGGSPAVNKQIKPSPAISSMLNYGIFICLELLVFSTIPEYAMDDAGIGRVDKLSAERSPCVDHLTLVKRQHVTSPVFWTCAMALGFEMGAFVNGDVILVAPYL